MSGHGLVAGGPAREDLSTDLHWMELWTEALYDLDARGRIIARNVPAIDHREAPRLFLGLTRHGVLWRLRADLPGETARALSRLAGAEPAPDDLDRLPDRLGALTARLEADAPAHPSWRGAGFRFPAVIAEADFRSAPVGAETDFRSAPAGIETDFRSAPADIETDYRSAPAGAESDFRSAPAGAETDFRSAPAGAETDFRSAPVVVEALDAGHAQGASLAAFPALRAGLAERLPAFAVMHEGHAISVAHVATLPRPAGGPVLLSVETAEGHRRRGHAGTALVALACELRRRGQVPLLAVACDDRAGLALARRLGLIRFGTALLLR